MLSGSRPTQSAEWPRSSKSPPESASPPASASLRSLYASAQAYRLAAARPAWRDSPRTSVIVSAPFDPDELDGLLEALQHHFACLRVGASGRGRGRSACEDFAALCERRDAGRRMDASPSVTRTVTCRLGRVDADPDLRREPVLAPVARQTPLDFDCALDCHRRIAECDEEAVASVVDLFATV